MGKKKNGTRKPDGAAGGSEDIVATPDRLRQFEGKPSQFKTDAGRIISRLSVVDAMYEADEISPEGFLASGLFVSDYFVGVHVKSTSTFTDKVDGSGNGDHFHAKRMDAAKRFSEAKAKIGPSSYGVLMAVVIDGDISLRKYAIDRLGASPKSNTATGRAKSLLIKAINRLAKFYAPKAKAPSRDPKTYMKDGYRPTIHPYQRDEVL